MKKIVAIFVSICLTMLIIPCTNVYALQTEGDEGCAVDGKYYPQDILAALDSMARQNGEMKSSYTALLDDILLPASMDIEIPHIDPAKVFQTVDVYTLNPEFEKALVAHGIIETSMTYSEYEKIENTWLLPQDFIESVKKAYPELNDVDMNNWTYGRYKEYSAQQDKERFLATLSDEQIKQFELRKIELIDLSCLLKEYHTVDAILRQSNKSLKETLEKAYAHTYDLLVALTQADKATPPLAYYTFVYFPRYSNGNGDYFHNSVLTTTYWQGIQADRALKTQECLYGVYSNTLYCTNMYGTYSNSQGGAHEGIDFVHPNGSSTPTIYAVFSGEKQYSSTSGQLSVYDADSTLGARTYTYLHMSSITATGSVSVLDSVGKQGNVGNATGYHVHFEVHSGKTTSLSSGADHSIGSITPYGMQEYIGCWAHNFEWAYNADYHWRECTFCGNTQTQYTHDFVDEICSTCGCAHMITPANKVH